MARFIRPRADGEHVLAAISTGTALTATLALLWLVLTFRTRGAVVGTRTGAPTATATATTTATRVALPLTLALAGALGAFRGFGGGRGGRLRRGTAEDTL